MADELLESRFWRWYRTHHSFDQRDAWRQEALEIVTTSVNAGEMIDLDGVDSPLSKRIKAHHRRDEFEMNSNWICSSQAWNCPCCGRSKFQVSRLGRQSQILAKLVVHHDHMGEVLKAAFHAAFEAAGTDTAQIDGRLLVERIGVAFAAYEEVLVCEDCNNADTEAKKLAATPDFFSFSIGQIRRFIRSRDHAPHEIEANTARQIWNAAKPAYELRMKLIRTVAHAAATDSHWYEPYAHTMRPIPIFGARPGDGIIRDWVSTEELCKALGPKPKAKTRNLSRWRTVPRKCGRPLPNNFLAMLRSDESRARSWDSVSDDWHCPICRRSKQETVYVKDGSVIFSPNSNPSRYWATAPTICGHCTSTLMSLKLEISDAIGHTPNNSYSIVTPEELASIVVARPHSSHSIRSATAATLVATVIHRLS